MSSLPYKERRVEGWPAAKAVLSRLDRSWIFRGQSCASWPLSHSLERSAAELMTLTTGINFAVDYTIAERFLLRMFHRRSSRYSSRHSQPVLR